MLHVIATEEEARGNCTQLDGASLLTVDSPEEQLFLNKFLLKFSHVSTNVWLGLKFEGGAYRWADGKGRNHTNWSIFADLEKHQESLKCVQMTLIENKFLGKWIQKVCEMKALIVCQREHVVTRHVLELEVKRLEQLLGKREALVRRQKSVITRLVKNQSLSEDLKKEIQELDEEVEEWKDRESSQSEMSMIHPLLWLLFTFDSTEEEKRR